MVSEMTLRMAVGSYLYEHPELTTDPAAEPMLRAYWESGPKLSLPYEQWLASVQREADEPHDGRRVSASPLLDDLVARQDAQKAAAERLASFLAVFEAAGGGSRVADIDWEGDVRPLLASDLRLLLDERAAVEQALTAIKWEQP